MPAKQLQIPAILVSFLVIIALVNGVADFYHWYWTMRWFDMPMHFAGGAWLALFGVWWQYSRRGRDTQAFLQILGVCMIFAISVGLIWEAYEAAVSFVTVGHMNAILDTLADIFFDILGGTVVTGLVWAKTKLK